jgi:hypothetical protein
VEVSVYSRDIEYGIGEYLHWFYANFGHEIGYGGDSGDSGGFIPTLVEEKKMLVYACCLQIM